MASVVVNGFAAANAMLGTNALAYLLATPSNQWALDQLSKGAMQVAVQNGAETSGGTLFLTPGDDFIYTATLTDADGEAYSLNGCTVWFTVKRRISDSDDNATAKAYWVSGGASSGITVASPTSGQIDVRLTPATTALFVTAAYYWDLQTKDTDGIISTVAEGRIVVDQGVTTRTTTP